MQVESRPDKNRGVFLCVLATAMMCTVSLKAISSLWAACALHTASGCSPTLTVTSCLHALSDALLGAAALGDIGKHFPDTDPQFKGADSRALLRHVVALVHAKGWKVGNVDNTIVAQAPKMAPHIESMRALIAADLQVELDQVNVKATTTEKLGFVGREEGIAVHSVALLLRA